MSSTLKAQDIMTRDTVTVAENMSVLAAADLLLERRVSNAPVVQKDFVRDVLLGFVSEKDIMQSYASGQLYSEPELRVRQIMRAHPVCVRPETDVFTLAVIFMQHGYRHVPVVVSQVLQGMVSRRDVLRALLAHYREWQQQDPATRSVPDLHGLFASRYLID